jgi:flagellar basal body-associated protein FliL
MAEEELNEQTDEAAGDAKAEDDGKKKKGGKKSKLRPLIFAIVVIVGGGAAGAGTAFFMTPGGGEEELTEEEAELPSSDKKSEVYDYAYYEFDPLTVNLNVPRANRYIRATVVLAVRSKDSETCIPLFDKRRAELTNWLMTYLAGLTLDEVTGRKNIVRLQREIRDAVNEQLWPDRRPRVEQVLFKDFAIQ